MEIPLYITLDETSSSQIKKQLGRLNDLADIEALGEE